MPEHLRAFVVVTALMALAFIISKRLFSQAVEAKFVESLFIAGYGSTAIMFLAHNMWLFLAGLAIVSLLAARRFTYPLAMFIFLLLLMPEYSALVPGLGLINYLIALNTWRVLALTVLLPAAFYLLNNPQIPKPGKLPADTLVVVFVLYVSALNYLHQSSFTGGLRQLITETLDVLLLYFVTSRSLMIKGAARHVMVALVMGCIYLALVGAFEYSKHWLLYSSVKNVLGSTAGMFGYLGRGDNLRAVATIGQSIGLGFVIMLGTLAMVYVQHLLKNSLHRKFLWGLMAVGLLAALARGPWVGAAVGAISIALVSERPFRSLLTLLTAGFVGAIILLLLPGGEKIIDYLPWVGAIDSSNITYRDLLLEQSQLVIKKNFWIGSVGYTDAPEFDVIRRDGFVDIVNSYIGIALKFGVIGLGLYGGLIFLSAMQQIRGSLLIRRECTERKKYSMALTGMLVAAVVTIFGVSSVSHIAPLVVFLIAAGVASASQNRLPK